MGVGVCLLHSDDHNSSVKKHQCEGIHEGSHSNTVIIAQIGGQRRRDLSFSNNKKKIKNKTQNHSNLGVMVLKSLRRLCHLQAFSAFLVIFSQIFLEIAVSINLMFLVLTHSFFHLGQSNHYSHHLNSMLRTRPLESREDCTHESGPVIASL